MNKLKELEGICVRGSKEHGARIIQAFTDAGATKSFRNGSDPFGFYYLENNCIVGVSPKTSNLTEITIDQLEEIVYKVDWENPPKYVTWKGLIVEVYGPGSKTNFSGKVVHENQLYAKDYSSKSWAKSCFRLLTSSELAQLEKELETPKEIAGVDFRCSLDALEAITVKPTEQPVKFTVYQRLRVLGFKKLKLNDKIFRDIYGHNPYQMRKQLDSKTFFTWDYSTPEKEDVQLVCDGVVISQSNVEEVERIINMLK